MIARAAHLAAAALIASCAVVAPATAGNLSFLNQTPLGHFKSDDMELMRQNARKVLDDPAANARQDWTNPNTGASGWAQVRSQFTSTAGETCKRLRVVNKVKGLESNSTYTVCKSNDADWAIHSDARPAQ